MTLTAIGMFMLFFWSVLGVATMVYVLVLGSQQLLKVVRLGTACQGEADRVMDDVKVPTFRRESV